MSRPLPNRRAVLRAVLVAAAAAAVPTGCATGAAATSPPPAPATTLVMIIRHGEKPDGSTPGVDAQGHEDDSSLTPVGWDRAHRLVDLLDPTPGQPRPGLARPVTIFAAGANDDGEGQRTRETVAPLAARLGIPVRIEFGKGDERDLVERIVAQPGPTLVCWQHGEIPDIADAFPGVTPTPPDEWPDDRFDVVWTLSRTADGWRFAQLPELVLPGDRPTVIAG